MHEAPADRKQTRLMLPTHTCTHTHAHTRAHTHTLTTVILSSHRRRARVHNDVHGAPAGCKQASGVHRVAADPAAYDAAPHLPAGAGGE
eukprot:scaffold61865_cov19-Tisochrysis_lutea.AAC.2